jgi:hypothetical protein
MKIAKRREMRKSGAFRAWLSAGALVLGTMGTASGINALAQEASAVQSAPAARFSPGVADVVKLVNAKVDLEVIKAYIQNSPTAYNPSATEIIALKDHGVGPEILTAMLQRGAEVRAQAMQAASAAAGPTVPQGVPAGANPYAPAYDYSSQPAYPTYAYPAASYGYPSYYADYPVSYYGGYNYGNCWPWYCPSFSFGCYPYCGYGGYSYCSSGHRYPYCYNGYRGGAYYGGRGYYGGGAYHGYGARSVPYGGRGGGFHSFGAPGRQGTFTRSAGGFRAGGGFSGHSVSFSRGGGGMRSAGGFGGRSMGRSR